MKPLKKRKMRWTLPLIATCAALSVSSCAKNTVRVVHVPPPAQCRELAEKIDKAMRDEVYLDHEDAVLAFQCTATWNDLNNRLNAGD